MAENEIDFALFPAFEIKKSKPLALIEKYDVIIFISVNAVNFAEEYFEELIISRPKVFAVGPVTANELLQKKIKV
ncbi:uroporphyrinogen-III synthase, partial [Candidatus Thioglobus sp.]|nr:uroporphyrinogen-III synthase [Candidatus Thioglobus sp.]